MEYAGQRLIQTLSPLFSVAIIDSFNSVISIDQIIP